MSIPDEISKQKLKHTDFVIPADNPYANDCLNREEFGSILCHFVDSIEGPLTISINGSWGTGKTTFLKMWNQNLRNKGFTTIYFSAWEDDYCDDPLMALVGQIYSSLKNGDWAEMGNTLKEVIKPLLGKMAFNALANITGGIANLNDTNLKSCFENAYDEYIETGSVLKGIKTRLKEQSEQCLQHKKPLVIVIDELDR